MESLLNPKEEVKGCTVNQKYQDSLTATIQKAIRYLI